MVISEDVELPTTSFDSNKNGTSRSSNCSISSITPNNSFASMSGMSESSKKTVESDTDDKRLSLKDIGKLLYTDLLPLNRAGTAETKQFLQQVLELCTKFLQDSNDPKNKIVDFHQPDEMFKLMDMEIPDEPMNLESLINDCNLALKYQVKTGHPHYFNQLSCGTDTVSLAGEWLTAAANTNMFTYEIAPVFILLESVVLKKMREVIGFGNGDSILCPGGSISNLYAILCARHKLFPEYKTKGLKALPQELVMFTSEQSHYSVMGAGAVVGLGTDNVVEVKADARGRMMPEELEKEVQKAIAAGKRPFFVNCTCGTTVLGSFDPIIPISDICLKYGMWFHIDAAWGGGLLLSKKYRHPRFTGVERADSITWNPHKLMGTLLQCSTVHFREDGLLMNCNQMCAEYLFQEDKQYYDARFDTGDKVIQCGRHNDIFKLWLMWRAKGMEGFNNHINHLMETSEYLVEQIKKRPEQFELLWPEPECVNVCFWYIPKRLRGKPKDKAWREDLGKVTAKLKAKMMFEGTLMINYQPLGDTPNFFRNIISNPGVQKSDVDFLISELDRLGADL